MSVDDPNDPRHPDHDLSEAAPYWQSRRDGRPWFARRWFLLVVALIVIAGMVAPLVR